MNNVPCRNGGGSANYPEHLVVMKFGGTSVEDAAAIDRLIQMVRNRRLRHAVVVVVSALAQTTDQLLLLGNKAADGELDWAGANLARLRQRHLDVARDLVSGRQACPLGSALEHDFEALNWLLRGVASRGHLSLRAQDHLLSFGERLSTKIVTASLVEAGVDAQLIDQHHAIVTDARHSRATPLMRETQLQADQFLRPLLLDERVPVVGGFIGSTLGGVATTLGRGGSDLSAAILAEALKASRLEIWTDVDGIMTGDPRICPDARLIDSLSFEEAAELAHCGAKVLHPATLLPAMRHNIPVWVLNSRTVEGKRTEILAQAPGCPSLRAVAAKRGICAVEIEAHRRVDPEFLHALSVAFDRQHCPVELMISSSQRVSLLVASTTALAQVASDLKALATVRWQDQQAVISLVGRGIRRQPELVGEALAALQPIEVRRLCQGASDHSISLLVDESQAVKAIQRLHASFFPTRAAEPGPAHVSSGWENSHALCQAPAEAWC